MAKNVKTPKKVPTPSSASIKKGTPKQATTAPVKKPATLEAPPSMKSFKKEATVGREARTGKVISKELRPITKKVDKPTERAQKKREKPEIIPFKPPMGDLPGQQPSQQEQVRQDITSIDPHDTNEFTPPEVEQIKESAGIFDTEPKPVGISDPYEKPGIAKTALAYGTALIPGVGMAGVQPLLAAQKKRKEQVAKDKGVSSMFWGAMKDDPIYAKQLIRVPFVRDMLQRTHGMSGEEILDLDKSITEEGIMSRRDFIQTMMKQGMQPEGGFQTEFGQITTPYERDEFVMQDGVIYNKRTGEVKRDQNKQRYEDLSARIRRAMPQLSEEDNFLTTVGMLSPGKPRTRITKTDTGLYIEDIYTGKGRMTPFGKKVVSPTWNTELISSDGITNDMMIMYNKDAQTLEDAKRSSTIIRFSDTLMPNGLTLQQELDEIRRTQSSQQQGSSKIFALIKSVYSYFNPADRMPHGAEQIKLDDQKPQDKNKKTTIVPDRVISPPPTRETQGGMLGSDELQKSTDFFGEMLGE